jgi:hypothetical protein
MEVHSLKLGSSEVDIRARSHMHADMSKKLSGVQEFADILTMLERGA